MTLPPSYANTQSTVDATFESPDEPSCGEIGATVWYAVTAPTDGKLKVSTKDSDFDTVLAAYSSSSPPTPPPPLNSLQSLDCNDDTGPGLTSAVQFSVGSGITYYIQAGGFQGAVGELSLSVTYGIDPSNDGFGSAKTAPEPLPYEDRLSTIVATIENEEPVPECTPPLTAPIGRTVWYSHTPSQTHVILATTAGSGFDTLLAAYTGDTLGALTQVACNDDADLNGTSAVQFVATAGTTYQIQAGGYGGDSGDLVVNIQIDRSDADGDGYPAEDEILRIGTDANDPCGTDGWPSNLVDPPPPSVTNALDIFDITSFLGPARRLDTNLSDYDDNTRWDLIPGRGPFSKDVNILDLTTLFNGAADSPAYPPMFGGLPAYNKTCPFP